MTKTDDDRAKRLADALRQNLRRRKAQARETPLAEPAQHDGQRKQDDDEHQQGS